MNKECRFPIEFWAKKIVDCKTLEEVEKVRIEIFGKNGAWTRSMELLKEFNPDNVLKEKKEKMLKILDNIEEFDNLIEDLRK